MKKLEINPWDIIWHHIIIKELDKKWFKRNFLYKCKFCLQEKTKTLSSILHCNNKSCWCKYNQKWEYNNMYWRKWELHPWWKWWKTNLRKTIYNSYNYKKWRKDVLSRDENICQITWLKWEMEVHHINPLRIISEWLEKENYNECDELWELENWITLLKEVHRKFHKIYWTWYNTKEDFYEFKSNYFKN